MTIEEAFDTFWYNVKQAKSAMSLLYDNTSVLSADHEFLSVELHDTQRKLGDLEMRIAKLRQSFNWLYVLSLERKES